MPTCDLHPDCQGQGCNADPEYCQRARDIHEKRRRNAAAASQAAMNRLRIARADSMEEPFESELKADDNDEDLARCDCGHLFELCELPHCANGREGDIPE